MTDADKIEFKFLTHRAFVVFKLLISLSLLFLAIVLSIKKGVI
jgi:hypothetical protein